MTEQDFKELILKNLEANDFPKNKVSLPLEKMYEKSEESGVNLNKILDDLKLNDGIDHDKSDDKIIFKKSVSNAMDGMDWDALKGMDASSLKEMADKFMKTMTPDQMSEIEEKFQNMSPEEKEEIMKKGKDMGLA